MGYETRAGKRAGTLSAENIRKVLENDLQLSIFQFWCECSWRDMHGIISFNASASTFDGR